jgi:flavorubredoxin
MADRPPLALAEGQTLSLGQHTMRWLDAPHLPHGWECGFMVEERTGTLLCGDLFTQPGKGERALTDTDILGPSEAFRHQMDYFSHAKDAGALIEKLAQTQPRTLACMHGSAWQGDGAALLRALAGELAR